MILDDLRLLWLAALTAAAKAFEAAVRDGVFDGDESSLYRARLRIEREAVESLLWQSAAVADRRG